MSLKYGLNVKKAAPPPARKTILDDEDEEDGIAPETDNTETAVEEISSFTSNGAPLTRKRKAGAFTGASPSRRNKREDGQDLSTAQASRAQVKAAEDIDPSIFDYDSFHDVKTTVTETKKAAARQDAIDRKPKYINNLLDAAAKRKQDQLIAREKLLQKEREAEGDEFADREKFVTGAYKQQQEEVSRLEEDEKKKAEAEEKRKRQLGGGMQGFYRGMMDRQERQHQEAMETAAKMEQEDALKPAGDPKEKSDADLVADLKAKGVSVHLNEEGQVTDKRDLLSAGLNVAPSGRVNDGAQGADHLRASARPAQSSFQGRNDAGRQGQRERQSRMMEEQLAAQAKRAREEEEEERERLEKLAKSAKTTTDISDAKARYLARKAAKERGEG